MPNALSCPLLKIAQYIIILAFLVTPSIKRID